MPDPITFRSEAFRKIQAGEVVDIAPVSSDTSTDTSTTAPTVQLKGVATKSDIEEVSSQVLGVRTQLQQITTQLSQLDEKIKNQDVSSLSTKLNNLVNYLAKWINTGNLNMNDIYDKVGQ